MSALTALLVFLISFALVAVLFRMPVSFALGTSSPVSYTHLTLPTKA